MAIIKSCCCGWTLRQGCYVSATFSLIYFFLFTWITGSMMVSNIQQLFSDQNIPELYKDTIARNSAAIIDIYDNKRLKHEDETSSNVVKEQKQQRSQLQQGQHVMDRTFSVTSFPSSNSPLKGNESGLERNNTKTSSASSSFQPNLSMEDIKERENESISGLKLILRSDAYAIAQTVILVLDLLCEVAGVYSSILLIRGLQQENKSWFWPWMIVVPSHIAIDAYTMGGIVMEYFVQPLETPLSLVLMTVSVDVILNSINAYGLICVISQYQEYKAGRGTAAYVEFTSQTPTIMLETASSTKTVLNQPIPNNRRKSGKDLPSSRNDKNDSYCEEFTMHTTVSHSSEKQSLMDGNTPCSQNNSHKPAKNGSIHQAKNGQALIIIPDVEMDNNGNNESSSRPIACKEVPSSSCTIDLSTITIEKSPRKSYQNAVRFGKYLDVHKRKSNLAKRNTKPSNFNRNPSQQPPREVKFDEDEARSIQTGKNKGEMKKSDSESEDDHSVSGLSAFGMISC